MCNKKNVIKWNDKMKKIKNIKLSCECHKWNEWYHQWNNKRSCSFCCDDIMQMW